MSSSALTSIAVFCGSAPGARPEYAAAARDLGTVLAARGIRLVYGGGDVGLMGTVADAVLDAGGAVTGVIPTALVDKELANARVTDMRVVSGMHERKQLMADLADAFIALPGGPGTLEELTEQWTWAQLGYHAKPCIVVNTAGFYDAFLAHIGRMTGDGFLREAQAGIVHVVDSPAEAITAIEEYVAPPPKWEERTPV